jgi:predicted site-specific integrase-resolvase
MARRRKQAGTGYIVKRKGKRGTTYVIRWRVNDGKVSEETVCPDRQEAEQALARRTSRDQRRDLPRQAAGDVP